MRMPRGSNSNGVRIADVPITRILILTLAAIKAGKVTKHMTDRNHTTGTVDDLKATIGNLVLIKAILIGTITAEANDHIREEHLLAIALELQAAQPLEPPGPRHGIVRVAIALARIKRKRILIRSL